MVLHYELRTTTYVAHYQTGTHAENWEEEEVKKNITFLDLDLATSKTVK